MSNGGLLEKAKEQQMVDEVVAEATPGAVVISQDRDIGIVDIIKNLLLFAVFPMIVIMWFGVYLDFIPLSILVPVTIGISLGVVWWRLKIGVPGKEGFNQMRAIVVAGAYLILLGFPLILGTVLQGEMSMGEIEFSEDGDTMTVKIRQNSLTSPTIDAEISIEQSDSVVWSGTESFSISKSDGRGDYGSISFAVSDFYSDNALPDSPYTIQISAGSVSMSATLDSASLSRTITSVKGSTSGVVSTNSDNCEGNKNTCVLGIALTAWAGLEALGGLPPAGLVEADYTLDATLLYEDSTTSISYPTVTVVNGQATWDSNSGEFGNGLAMVGLEGSQLPLAGSVENSALNTLYIPKEDWGVSDYGCYEFQVSVTQSPPWGDRTAHVSTTYYEYTEEGADDDWDEAWTPVSSC
jgi:hypothetical protein